QLTDEAKDALILRLWEALQKLQKKRPKKTSKNSSLPPAKGFKAEVKSEAKGSGQTRVGSLGREGGGRALSEHPDQIIESTVKTCQDCGAEIAKSEQQRMERYDKIDIPPIAPIVTRVERYGCRCPQCGAAQLGAVPVGMEPGSPFGNRIAALVTTMRYSHGISYGRMQQMLSQVFGLEMSEGAIANLLLRVKGQLQTEVDGILAALRSARLVGSDETSARVNGKNQWEWVFQNEQVCFHIIRPSRGGNVITEVMADHRPQVWVSDLFSAQKTHPGESWQVCLAHQLRDCQYGMDAGDEIFSARMKTLLLRAFVLQRRWLDLAQSTRYQYRFRLYRDLKAVLALSPIQADGIRLQNRYRKLQENLFLFLDDSTIPPTNNASEQALRWSVIFRKVTNGFRSDWGRDLFAAVRSIVNTGRRQGLSAFESILAALNPLESLFPLS
ncbi:MAG: IS66 family transposase, partial [Leptolyngbyaceae cyanobacterium CAN_BIN12]|nr:IS66 family transposase [Leptolyngbyaceae cyanobacterium CAN_BIN12]